MGCCVPHRDHAAIGAPDPGSTPTSVRMGWRRRLCAVSTPISRRSEWMRRFRYGTASGLAVTIRTTERTVHASMFGRIGQRAVGKMIASPRPVRLINGWLSDPNHARWRRTSGCPRPDHLLSDALLPRRAIAVPVPGEPCRSDAALMQPSRIADDYCLTSASIRRSSGGRRHRRLLGPIDDIADEGSARRRSIPPSGRQRSAPRCRHRRRRRRRFVALGSLPVLLLPPGVGIDDYDEFIKLAYRIWITEFRRR